MTFFIPFGKLRDRIRQDLIYPFSQRPEVGDIQFVFYTMPNALCALCSMPYALLLERNRLVVFIKTRRTRNDCIVIIACRPFAGDVVEEVITWISKLGVLGDKL